MNTKKKTRTANILIRVTPGEKKQIQQAAKKAGVNVTEYLIESARQRSTSTGS